ncbi:MAG: M14 family zinc carboxypeptidase [Armatimonadota bacterium]
MRFYTRLVIAIFFFLITSTISAETGSASPPKIPATPPPIAIIPSDGFNLKVVEQPTPSTVILAVDPPVHNWWSGTLTHLPTDKEVAIGLSLEGEGMDTAGNKADVGKWQGLRPVMTYGDPTKYETYEWYQKDNIGRWVSGDPFKKGNARYAGAGTVPLQSVIPGAVAAQFLSEGGKYWQPWREIDSAEAVTKLNIFRLKQKFAFPTATVAMRVPFTYTYLQQLLERLRAAKIPGVYIDEIGKTLQGNKLQVIRIEDPCSFTPLRIFGYRKSLHPNKIPIVWVDYTVDKHVPDDQKVFLITAREHATEQASSWVVHGMLRMLISDNEFSKALRKHTTWLLIPIQDPDGSILSLFDTLTDKFWQHSTNPVDNNPPPVEVLAYANYLRAFMNSNRPIAASVTWHNVECNEGENIFAPFITVSDEKSTVLLNQQWFTVLRNEGYITGKANGNDIGFMRLRLYGWCGLVYHSMPIAYEVNDRYPRQILPLNRLEGIGGSFVSAFSQFYTSEVGKRHLADLTLFLHQRQQAIELYYASGNHIGTRDDPSIEEILSSGY